VGPTGLDTIPKRKIPRPRWESNPDHPIVHPVASLYTDWAIPALQSFSTVSEISDLRIWVCDDVRRTFFTTDDNNKNAGQNQHLLTAS
jgi:hypothetical protein